MKVSTDSPQECPEDYFISHPKGAVEIRIFALEQQLMYHTVMTPIINLITYKVYWCEQDQQMVTSKATQLNCRTCKQPMVKTGEVTNNPQEVEIIDTAPDTDYTNRTMND